MLLEIQCHAWALGCFCYNVNVVGHEINWKKCSYLEMFSKHHFNDNSEDSAKIWTPFFSVRDQWFWINIRFSSISRVHPKGKNSWFTQDVHNWKHEKIEDIFKNIEKARKISKKIGQLRIFDRNSFSDFAQIFLVLPQILKEMSSWLCYCKLSHIYIYMASIPMEILENLFSFFDFSMIFGWSSLSNQSSRISKLSVHPSKHSINIVWSMCFKYTNWFSVFICLLFPFFPKTVRRGRRRRSTKKMYNIRYDETCESTWVSMRQRWKCF